MSRPAHTLQRAAALVALTAATAVAAVGCATTPEAPAATAGESIRIMVISNDEPGPQLPQGFPEVSAAARASAAEINDRGGVDGRSIEIEHCETGGDPNVAVQCAQEAVRDGYPAVVGSFDVIGNHAAVLEEAGIPMIGPWSSNEKWLENPLAYPITAGGMLATAGEISSLANGGAETIAAVYSSISAAPAATVLDPIREVRPELTIEQVIIPQNSIDYSASVATAVGYDAIAVNSLENDTIAFLKALDQHGHDDVLVASFPLTPHALEELGPLADGVISVSAFYPPTSTDVAAVATYVEYMEKTDPDVSIDEFSANTYAAVQIFAQAAEGLDEVTSETLIERLDTGESFDPKLAAPISFREAPTTGPGFSRFFNQNVVLLRAQDGVYALDSDFFNAYTGEPTD